MCVCVVIKRVHQSAEFFIYKLVFLASDHFECSLLLFYYNCSLFVVHLIRMYSMNMYICGKFCHMTLNWRNAKWWVHRFRAPFSQSFAISIIIISVFPWIFIYRCSLLIADECTFSLSWLLGSRLPRLKIYLITQQLYIHQYETKYKIFLRRMPRRSHKTCLHTIQSRSSHSNSVFEYRKIIFIVFLFVFFFPFGFSFWLWCCFIHSFIH